MVYIQFILEKYTQTFPYKGTSAPALTLHASQLWDCTLLQPRLISHLISQRCNNAASSPQLLPQWDLGWGWSGLHITRHTITATGLFSSSNERKGEASTRHCLKIHFLDVWLVGVQVPPVCLTDWCLYRDGGWGMVHNELGCLCPMSKQASEAAVPLRNTEQIWQWHSRSAQSSLPLGSSPPRVVFPSFYCPPFHSSLSRKKTHRCAHSSISRLDPSPPKSCRLGFSSLCDGWAWGARSSARPFSRSASRCRLLSKRPPLPLNGLGNAAAEQWHQEEACEAKAFRLLPVRVARFSL